MSTPDALINSLVLALDQPSSATSASSPIAEPHLPRESRFGQKFECAIDGSFPTPGSTLAYGRAEESGGTALPFCKFLSYNTGSSK
jgi:hypothetical protein